MTTYVCYCFCVKEDVIIKAIKEKSLRTVEEVRTETTACCGCQTCWPDIEDLLEKYGPKDESKETENE